jgi:hypothetical protein
MKEDATVKLTHTHIEQAKSASGGWTKEQLRLIGVSWPPAKGWRLQVVGRELPVDSIDAFLRGRKD